MGPESIIFLKADVAEDPVLPPSVKVDASNLGIS